MIKSQLETDFLAVWKKYGPKGYALAQEHPFEPQMWISGELKTRRWRFDFVLVDHLIAIELEGMSGRHQSNKGFRQDCEKYSVACSKGWRVLRFIVNDVTSRPEWVIEIIEDTISEVELSQTVGNSDS